MKQKTKVGSLELNPIHVDVEYCKKWNVNLFDFMLICKDGEPLRNTLYRLGGLSSLSDVKKDYFMLIKHVEEYYDDEITKDPKRKPHLASHWAILDKHGNERVVFDRFKSPYLHGGPIYSLDNAYYNIETGHLYAKSYQVISSDSFLFLENKFDDDKSRCGVLKISKLDGTYEIFK